MKKLLPLSLSCLFFLIFSSSSKAQGEIGFDVRLTSHGPAGNTDYDATAPSIAYNSLDNQFLIVYSADVVGNLGRDEIFGQLYDANIGTKIGPTFQISQISPATSTLLDATNPKVVYNSTNNNYLVSWQGDATSGIDEICTQVVSSTGTVVGGLGNHNVISSPLLSGQSFQRTTIAYNSTDNNYLIAYFGDLVANGIENIYICIVHPGGSVAVAETAITNNTLTSIDDLHPDVAYNPVNNEYIVTYNGIYSGSNDAIYARRISALGVPIGPEIAVNNALNSVEAIYAEVVHNPFNNEYFIAWHDSRINSNNEEIYGRALDASGALIGPEIRLSVSGSDTDNLEASKISTSLEIFYSPFDGEIHLSYIAEEFNSQQEAYVTVLDAGNYNLVQQHTRVSDMGSSASSGSLDVQSTTLAFNTTKNKFLVIWEGDDDSDGTDGEDEIYGQFWEGFGTHSNLPVELTYFGAKRQDAMQVDLHWQTATEINSKKYLIERSWEGEFEFEVVGEVAAEGNSLQNNHYHYTDANADSRTSYYRLKMVDTDDSYRYTDIKAVRGEKQKIAISTYPNPVQEQINLLLQGNNKNAKISILSISGKLLYQQNCPIPSSRLISIDAIKAYPKGTYIIHIQTEDLDQVSQKIVKS